MWNEEERRKEGDQNRGGRGGIRWLPHRRCPESEKYKKVDKERSAYMDEKVHDVVAENIQPSDVIVQGKGKIADEAPGIIVVALAVWGKVFQIFNDRIINNLRSSIKQERTVKSIAVSK